MLLQCRVEAGRPRDVRQSSRMVTDGMSRLVIVARAGPSRILGREDPELAPL
jgi:hypothetical protein